MSRKHIVSLSILLSFLGFPSLRAETTTLTVYTERKEHLVKPVFEEYTKKTGIKLQYRTDTAAALTARIQAEGDKSPADIFLTVDAGSLWNAARLGLLQPLLSQSLLAQVPSAYRDAEGRWFGLSLRARTIVYNPDKVKESELKDYASLGNARFQKRLCLRSAKKVYNQSLVAMMIAEKGEAKAEAIVASWIANLAAPVFQDDTNVIEAVAAGQCEVGIANSYYYGRLLEKQPGVKAKLFFPKLADGGTHVNISGAGVLRSTRHAREAQRFLEWLASEEAQGLFARLNHEYPVNPKVKASAEVLAWGNLTAAPMNLSQAGEFQTQAIKLMDRAGYR